MRNKLKQELKTAFDAPTPEKKDKFINQLDFPKASRIDFILSQLGYIRKRVWIMTLLLFFGTLFGLYICRASTSFVWIVSSVLPFISLVSISEISKSITCNMDELEMSCKYNLLEVSLIRMGILGAMNFVIFIGLIILFMGKTEIGFVRLGLYLLTPYLLNCYGTLFFINRIKSRETTFICGGVTAFVSILNTMLTVQIHEIYTEKYRVLWILAFIILAVLSVKEFVRLIKKMEDLQWNSSLTV